MIFKVIDCGSEERHTFGELKDVLLVTFSGVFTGPLLLVFKFRGFRGVLSMIRNTQGVTQHET